MPRPRPPDRLEQLAESAVKVFTARGYRRAQMADVAREMGVAPGTLYLYVESKEALFDLAVRHALANGAGELPSTLRIAQKLLRDVPDVDAGVRLIGEIVAWFARHRYADPEAGAISDDVARRTV